MLVISWYDLSIHIDQGCFIDIVYARHSGSEDILMVFFFFFFFFFWGGGGWGGGGDGDKQTKRSCVLWAYFLESA